MEQKFPIFVYGSLRKGFQNSEILKSSEFFGIYKTVDPFQMISLKSKAYPYLLEESINETPLTQIVGELYSIDLQVLNRLDELEGHPHFYTRVKKQIYNDSHWIYADIYILQNKEIIGDIKKQINKRFEIVLEGDWKSLNTNPVLSDV